MPQKLPLACTTFGRFTQTEFLGFAIASNNGLLTQIATFPTPPYSHSAMAALITAYNTALDNAVLLGKDLVAAKNAARKTLENAIRTNASYINQILQGMVATGTDYADIETLILSTGYVLSIEPSPVGPLPEPVVISSRSTNKGQLYIHVGKVPGAKTYQVQYSFSTDPDTILTFISPSSRITVPNLPSASIVTARVVGNGANTSALNFSVPITQVIV